MPLLWECLGPPQTLSSNYWKTTGVPVDNFILYWRSNVRHLLENPLARHDSLPRSNGRIFLPKDRWSNVRSSKVTLPKTIGRISWPKPNNRIRPSRVSLPIWVKNSQSFLYYFSLMTLWIVCEVPTRGYSKRQYDFIFSSKELHYQQCLSKKWCSSARNIYLNEYKIYWSATCAQPIKSKTN